MPSEITREQTAATLGVVCLAAVTAASGLLRPRHYRDAAGFVTSYRMQDLTILVVGVPVLAAGLWFAARRSPRGRIVWLGGLAYMTYVWPSVAVQVAFNDFFLVYVALFSLSLFTLVSGLVTTDAAAIEAAVADRIAPARYSGFLALVGVGLATLWLTDLVPPLFDGRAPLLVEEAGQQALVSHVIDLGVVVPAILLSAVWLYRRRTWGYVFAGVVLVLGAVLAASVASMTLVFAGGEAVTVAPVAAVLTLVPVGLSVLLAVTYLLSMDGGDSPENERRR